jgi:hypothetical protein
MVPGIEQGQVQDADWQMNAWMEGQEAWRVRSRRKSMDQKEQWGSRQEEYW